MSPAWNPIFVQTSGLSLATYQFGDGDPVILLHGFPELAYSWRHQIAALTANDWRVIAPDLRGYGRTGAHGDLSAYAMRNLSLDVVGMMDALAIDRAVVVGHDFGGSLAWSLARSHADRVAGVISLNTPYTRRGERSLLETMRQHRGETNYMVRFQEPGVGEALLERDVAATFQGLMRRPAITQAGFAGQDERLRALPMTLFVGEPAVMGDPIMSDAELQIYIDAFRRSGFAGPLNWYRNLEANWRDTADEDDVVTVPALMITASDDYFLPPRLANGMEKYVSDLERQEIAHCGHWTQQEHPGEVNDIIVEWLERRMSPLFG